MSKNWVGRAVVGALCLGSVASFASTVTVFNGIDLNVASGSALPNSNAAQGQFAAAVNGLGQPLHTIDFESLATGAISGSLSLGQGASLSLANANAGAGISNTQNSVGMFNTTSGGGNYFAFETMYTPVGTTTTATATFTFASPIDSFGAYFTGLDTDAVFSINFFDGTSESLLPSLGTNSAEFFGFTSPGQSISSVTLSMTDVPPATGGNSSWAYFAGVDDVQFSNVPEPGSLALVALALSGLLLTHRKRAC
jgi:hypothetical protein